MIYIFIIVTILLLYLKIITNMHMFQQNLYNENNRYFKWLLNNYKQFIDIDLICLILSIVGVFVAYDLFYFSVLLQFVICCLYGTLCLFLKKRIANNQNKKPLVITSRVKRLIFTTVILYLLPCCLLLLDGGAKYQWYFIFIMSLMIWLNCFVIFISNIINFPYERCVYYYYKNKAQKKLNSMNNLKIIGITGSYGKTSSKNILGEILNTKYNALPTPRNLNTYNGLIMTVNNYMDKFTDIFIAEMGAYVKGEIAGLCKLVKPKYGILTTIGTAHLESFGSEQNIIDAKFELIESLPSDGFAVLNGDDPKQLSYKLKNKVRTIWIGINNKDADIRAINIKCSNYGTNFDVVFKDDEKIYNFTTSLLGNHNVYNILASIACGREFGISMENLIRAVKNVKAVEHRLQLKRLGNFYQIDDAYNSNPVGARNACIVLGMMPGIKVVVTPGMIELGAKENEYNKEFGKQIAEVADYVVLIGSKKTEPIRAGLLEKGFDNEKIVIFNDVRDAYPFIDSLTGEKDVYALFENDLPDTYNE